MGYQALLFCPDEKTARTVTQVLSELDFTVVPCTEPFAAVKKLMSEHFDAVVVDCDNEQNATLLFKSARNAPNNQSALAVAVVEGQAGVAKAFRIGANLVLTKPINVEQAKGTLRVARGLLRKNESTKPATTTTPTSPKPTASAPAPAKPTLVSNVNTARPAAAVSSIAALNSTAQKPASSFAASASGATSESGDSAESNEPTREVVSPHIVPVAVSEPKPEIQIETTSSKTVSDKTTSDKTTSDKITPGKIISSSAGLSIVASSGAASAAAPAREVTASVAAQDRPSTVGVEPAVVTDAVGAVDDQANSAVDASASPAPSFTFGGTLQGGTDAAGGGSKKTLVAVAAVVLIAAGGYVAWTQFGHSSGTVTTTVAPVALRPASPAPLSQAAPSAVDSAPSSSQPASTRAASTLPASGARAISTSTGVGETGSAKASAAAPTTPSADGRPSKADSGASKAAAVIAAEDKAAAAAVSQPEVAQPIVVKKSEVVGKSSPTSDISAPNIAAIASTGNGGTLPNLLGNQTNAPAPVLQTLSISQGVSQGLVIKKVLPAYPANALHMRTEGSVQLLATISKRGDISAVKILSGDPGLARAAVDAVKQWKYKPYLLDGNPVDIQTQVTVNFKLPPR
jgi:TonB family protein